MHRQREWLPLGSFDTLSDGRLSQVCGNFRRHNPATIRRHLTAIAFADRRAGTGSLFINLPGEPMN